ncbi:MAG: response regulator transcription factor [Trueperaceae bacterium]
MTHAPEPTPQGDGPAATRVLIADDHPLFRMGLAHALRGRGFDVVAEAENGRHAVELARARRPDVVLLDVRMPVMDGIEACTVLAASDPAPCVVMLTTYDEPAVIHAARRAGATAYLSKETDPARLAELLVKIVQERGRDWMPQVDLPELTGRERETLALLADGLTNREIADRLGIGAETIKDHVASLYRKFDVNDRVSCVREAERMGFV